MLNGFDTVFQVVQGNYGFNLPFTLQDSAGVAVDISNATLVFECQLESNETIQFSGAMVKVNGPAGTCYYTVAQTDFSVAGVWNAQIIATFAGEVLTFPGITITALDQLPIS
jgi:hypothetical protein